MLGLLEQPEVRFDCTTLTTAQGVVGFMRPLAGSFWSRWFTKPGWAIHEAGDEPLVFTISRRFSLLPRWEVCDAEGDWVGIVGGRWAVDRWERPVFRLDPDGALRSAGRHSLGHWDGQRLAFSPETTNEPLVRMLMLALILSDISPRQ
ncbi:MAG: hypothetical protein EBV06_09690 [Planctomycetia bacterium]|nr:hypothetical protein [Planctomycetia bacterium]